MSSRASGRLIDREEVPFTVREIVRATSLLWPPHLARKFAAELAREASRYARYRAHRRALWRRHGYTRREPLLGLTLPDEILAALTVISSDTAARVKPLLRARWRGLRRAFVQSERRAAGRRAGIVPTKREAFALARKAGIDQVTGEAGDLWRGLVIRTPPLPKATARMLALVEKRLVREKRRWEATLNRVKRRFQHRELTARD